MNDLLEMIDDGSACSLVFLIVILTAVSTKFSQGRPFIQRLGSGTAGLVFVAYGIYGWFEFQPRDANDWIGVALRGLLATGLGLGLSWIVFTIVAVIWENTFKRLFHGACLLAKAAYRWRRQLRERLQQSEETREVNTSEQSSSQEEEDETESVSDDRKRRENARIACELLYSLYPEIGKRFSKDAFDDFVHRYMGDDQPPDVVESRAGQLQDVIQKHYEQVRPPESTADLEQLANWYEEQKTRIESLSVDDSYKAAYLTQLNSRYAELMQRLLETLEP